jgi:hypothetical protein
VLDARLAIAYSRGVLTRNQKRAIALIHTDTSDTVRAWLSERTRSSLEGNPWAEAQLKAFLKAYQRFGTGTAALRYLEGGTHEQLTIGEDDG